MSKTTQPDDSRPHSILAASVGSRLRGVHGRGRVQAPLVWLAVLAHTPWDGAERPTWASNETLGNETGLPVGDVENALARLRGATMLATYDGHRPGALRRWGRILDPDLPAPVRVLMPSESEMENLWRALFKIRKQPIALVTLMVGMFVIASHARGSRPTRWSPVPGPIAGILRLVGATHGRPVSRRFDELEKAGLISRKCGLTIAPPSEWVVRAPGPARGPDFQATEVESTPTGHDPQWDLDPEWS